MEARYFTSRKPNGRANPTYLEMLYGFASRGISVELRSNQSSLTKICTALVSKLKNTSDFYL